MKRRPKPPVPDENAAGGGDAILQVKVDARSALDEALIRLGRAFGTL